MGRSPEVAGRTGLGGRRTDLSPLWSFPDARCNRARARYCATQPPSIDKAAPVIVEAASPHRKTASAPIFSGVV